MKGYKTIRINKRRLKYVVLISKFSITIIKIKDYFKTENYNIDELKNENVFKELNNCRTLIIKFNTCASSCITINKQSLNTKKMINKKIYEINHLIGFNKGIEYYLKGYTFDKNMINCYLAYYKIKEEQEINSIIDNTFKNSFSCYISDILALCNTDVIQVIILEEKIIINQIFNEIVISTDYYTYEEILIDSMKLWHKVINFMYFNCINSLKCKIIFFNFVKSINLESFMTKEIFKEFGIIEENIIFEKNGFEYVKNIFKEIKE